MVEASQKKFTLIPNMFNPNLTSRILGYAYSRQDVKTCLSLLCKDAKAFFDKHEKGAIEFETVFVIYTPEWAINMGYTKKNMALWKAFKADKTKGPRFEVVQ